MQNRLCFRQLKLVHWFWSTCSKQLQNPVAVKFPWPLWCSQHAKPASRSETFPSPCNKLHRFRLGWLADWCQILTRILMQVGVGGVERWSNRCILAAIQWCGLWPTVEDLQISGITSHTPSKIGNMKRSMGKTVLPGKLWERFPSPLRLTQAGCNDTKGMALNFSWIFSGAV